MVNRVPDAIFGALVGLGVLSLLSPASAQQKAKKPFKAQLPVLVASCGQSPGPMKIKVFLRRLKFAHTYKLQATAKDLVAQQKKKKPFKTLIIVTGASLKGMGAAGVSVKDELERTAALIKEAKKQKITIIGAHVEGMARRAASAAVGDNSDELSIDAVCPEAALLIVRKDGDKDKRFTTISRKKKIPIVLFNKNMELLGLLRNLFGTSPVSAAAKQDQAKKPVQAQLPVLVTSCGQSPGPMKIKVFLRRLKLAHTYKLQATAKDLIASQKTKSPFRTLIIVTGASLKGMGAAGVSVKDELRRTAALIQEAKKQKLMIIGAHVEGMARRAASAAPGDNSDELSIDAVCPQASLLIVRSDGDKDKRFTTIAKAKKIPIVLFNKNMELMGVLKGLFTKKG